MPHRPLAALLAVAALAVAAPIASAAPNVRLTNDVAGGYVSAYTLATGQPYSDAVINECSIARGRQNEPSVAVDPRDARVLLGSSNEYCGVYAGSTPGNFVAAGPIWLGYYRSENSGASFRSSLVPGYPGDTSPYASLARIRTASGGDPVIAWDGQGRAFIGAESSEDPAGSKKGFGDVWVATYDNPAGPSGATINDGKRYRGSSLVAKGSSAPGTGGKFHDKTAIEADRTASACAGNVYFAWSRFTGNGGVAIYFARSTDRGASWSNPVNLTPNGHDLQFPDIAITGNGHVYVTWRQIAAQGNQPNAAMYAKSVDCGATFARPRTAAQITPWDVTDVAAPVPLPTLSRLDDPLSESGGAAPGSSARDCGDFDSACQSGYTFFRVDTQVRSTADQSDTAHEDVFIVFEQSKPGTQMPTYSTYGTLGSGTGTQAGIYFARLDGATGAATAPALIDAETRGHQLFPDISADGGSLHAVWWDSRNDPTYLPSLPIGNAADRTVHNALDAFGARSTNRGGNWTGVTQLSSATSNPNYEQFSNRTVPFAGDYLWVTSVGPAAYSVWTDWRNTVAGPDPREASADDNDGADVKQCRTLTAGAWSGDQCPHDGGLDQNIYGSVSP